MSPYPRLTDKVEVLDMFDRALENFDHVSVFKYRQIGALIEALHLYCDQAGGHDPDLFNNACQEAARLRDLRMATDPEYVKRKAELLRQIQEMTDCPLTDPRKALETKS